jgi:hypothetical protein
MASGGSKWSVVRIIPMLESYDEQKKYGGTGKLEHMFGGNGINVAFIKAWQTFVMKMF